MKLCEIRKLIRQVQVGLKKPQCTEMSLVYNFNFSECWFLFAGFFFKLFARIFTKVAEALEKARVSTKLVCSFVSLALWHGFYHLVICLKVPREFIVAQKYNIIKMIWLYVRISILLLMCKIINIIINGFVKHISPCEYELNMLHTKD